MLGRPILIEDIDEYLPTILDPILKKLFFSMTISDFL
jgi:hypothetical protein